MKIRLNSGLPQWLVDALGLREGRQGFESALDLDSGVVPVVILAGGLSGSAVGVDETDVAAGQAFTGFGFNLAGGAGVVSHVQLFNPVGSGVNGYVYCAHGSTGGAASLVSVRRSSVALGILFATQGSNNDLAVGNVPKLQIREHGQNPAQGTEFDGGWNTTATVLTFDFRPSRPWRLQPGQGLQTTVNAGNLTNQTAFYWTERPIT